jgi:predicted molibdopterin-dependent oxidoreductase YjgC
VIHSESPAVIASRKNTLQKMLSTGNHNCAIRDFNADDWTAFHLQTLETDQYNELCPVWGSCKLQDLAYRYQVTTRHMPLNPSAYPMERENPFILRDFSRCIMCGRCVKACREVQVNNAIDFNQKDKPLKIIAGTDVPLKDSDCVFCGECVEVCPVGALIPKESLKAKTRFKDVKKVRTTCSFCGVGCQMELSVQNNKIVGINSAGKDVAPNNGSLGVKGRYGYDFVASPNRLTTPLIRKEGKLTETSWDEALDYVATRLNEIKDRSGSDSMGLLTSARVTNEENYIAQKFARAVLKTNNVDHCARL